MNNKLLEILIATIGEISDYFVTLSQFDFKKVIEKSVKKEVDKIPKVTPEKGDKGDTYILTDDDKKQIATLVVLPTGEKVIERIETPIIREIAKYEEAEAILKKIEGKIEIKSVKGLVTILQELSDRVVDAGKTYATSPNSFLRIFNSSNVPVDNGATTIQFGQGMNTTKTPNGVLVDATAVSDKNYTQDFSATASPLTIVHNLGKFPAVGIKDSANDEVEVDVNYVDLNTVTIAYSAPFSGTIICN